MSAQDLRRLTGRVYSPGVAETLRLLFTGPAETLYFIDTHRSASWETRWTFRNTFGTTASICLVHASAKG